jgi:hypothetical protein
MSAGTNRNGRGYQVVGAAILILAVVLAKTLQRAQPRDALMSFFSFDSSSGSAIGLTIVLFLVVAPILGYAAVAMLRRGRQIRANVLASRPINPGGLRYELRDQQGRAVGSIDVGSAVLYLRSFAEDNVTAESRHVGSTSSCRSSQPRRNSWPRQ